MQNLLTRVAARRDVETCPRGGPTQQTPFPGNPAGGSVSRGPGRHGQPGVCRDPLCRATWRLLSERVPAGPPTATSPPRGCRPPREQAVDRLESCVAHAPAPSPHPTGPSGGDTMGRMILAERQTVGHEITRCEDRVRRAERGPGAPQSPNTPEGKVRPAKGRRRGGSPPAEGWPQRPGAGLRTAQALGP